MENLPFIPSLKTFLFWGEIFGLFWVPIILIRKRHPVSAWAWSLTVVFIPWLGVLFYIVFGAFRIKRRIHRKQLHRSRFLRKWVQHQNLSTNIHTHKCWEGMDQLALRVGGSLVTDGNEAQLYFDGTQAFADKLAAIEAARHHIHLEYFILRNDETSRTLIDLLCRKAREGVQVRLLVDAIGSRECTPLLHQLRNAGGKAHRFLPATLNNRFTIGLRNHRKLLIVDGTTGFMGGLNVGDEYLGKSSWCNYWRDTHMRIIGPAVLAMQRSFVEDWDFTTGELLSGDPWFPAPKTPGAERLQIVASGPDQEHNACRETYFAAITSARWRIWISTPYLVPDGSLLAALHTAALRGVDVRILTQSYPPDHWITYWAGRYFWEELLAAGVKIFEYQKGMLHSKLIVIDSAWGCLGSANLDIRSIRLNFEINCHIHSKNFITQMENMFEKDLADSREIPQTEFNHRPLQHKLAENFCRMFSPLL